MASSSTPAPTHTSTATWWATRRQATVEAFTTTTAPERSPTACSGATSGAPTPSTASATVRAITTTAPTAPLREVMTAPATSTSLMTTTATTVRNTTCALLTLRMATSACNPLPPVSMPATQARQSATLTFTAIRDSTARWISAATRPPATLMSLSKSPHATATLGTTSPTRPPANTCRHSHCLTAVTLW